MIVAMPAVSVRHERRKGVEKRSKRPSKLYIGGNWLLPTCNTATPSPNVETQDLTEYYFCGKVSALQIIVSSILLGAIVLIVGLVQLVPNAADADHRHILLVVGSGLMLCGLVVTIFRCICIEYRYATNRKKHAKDIPVTIDLVNSIDVLVQMRDVQVKPTDVGYSLLKFEEDSVDKPKYFN